MSVNIRLCAAGALAVSLAIPGTAHAQLDDAGGFTQGGFTNPVVARQVLLLELYQMQLQQLAALPQETQDELAKRAAEYFTNGAEAVGVPTSGPGAAYFQNGAEVTAAQTAAPAEGSAEPPSGLATAADAAAPLDSGSGAASNPPAANAKDAGLSESAWDGAVPASAPTAAPSEPSQFPGAPGSPPSQGPTVLAGSFSNPRVSEARVMAAMTSPANEAIARARRSVGGIAPWLGGIGFFGLIAFLGARLRSRKARVTGSP